MLKHITLILLTLTACGGPSAPIGAEESSVLDAGTGAGTDAGTSGHMTSGDAGPSCTPVSPAQVSGTMQNQGMVHALAPFPFTTAACKYTFDVIYDGRNKLSIEGHSNDNDVEIDIGTLNLPPSGVAVPFDAEYILASVSSEHFATRSTPGTYTYTYPNGKASGQPLSVDVFASDDIGTFTLHLDTFWP